MSQTSKTLASVSTTSVLVTNTSGKEVARVPCIYYPIQFRENQEQIRILLNSGSKVNTMSPTFVQKLDLHIRKTNVGAQKIDGSALKTFKMVIADFQVEDKSGRARFF